MTETEFSNAQQLEQINAQLTELNQHRFVRAHDSWLGLVLFNMVRGLAFGLGSVIGATVLVALFVTFLRQIDFVPILGDWAIQIIEMINER